MQELSAQKPKISDQIPMSEEIETSTEKTHSKPMNLTLGLSGDVDSKGVYELISKLQEELNQRLQEQDKGR